MNNWSRNALLWNLANNASFGPSTPGGCSVCMGALTISGSTITRNPGYYIIGQASKFVPAGSIRVASSTQSNLPNVAFMTPGGGKALIVTNSSTTTTQTFNIGFKGKTVSATLQPGSVGTFVWQ
jgi:glucosylceramidase